MTPTPMARWLVRPRAPLWPGSRTPSWDRKRGAASPTRTPRLPGRRGSAEGHAPRTGPWQRPCSGTGGRSVLKNTHEPDLGEGPLGTAGASWPQTSRALPGTALGLAASVLPLASSGTVPRACPPGASPRLPPGPTCPSCLCSGHTLSSNRQWLWGAQSLPQDQPGRIWAQQPRRPPSPTTRPPLLTWEFTCRNPIYLTSWREPPKPGSAQRGAAQLPPIALLQTQPGCGPAASACAHVPVPTSEDQRRHYPAPANYPAL